MCLAYLLYTVGPCLIHTCHAAPMPCSDHAVLLKGTAQHIRRETAWGLPARVRLLPATTRSSTKIVIRNIPILLTTIHTYDCKEWQHTLQKRRSVQLLDYQFGYFRLPRGISRKARHCRSRAGARHGMYELTNGMGTAWAWHAMCESAFTQETFAPVGTPDLTLPLNLPSFFMIKRMVDSFTPKWCRKSPRSVIKASLFFLSTNPPSARTSSNPDIFKNCGTYSEAQSTS